ncbi:MAG: hypothetical protein PHV74_11895 [Dehalococcoidia bacterium]|nr:hypothetical protein [Dehalococcoidia bacterium]
MAEEPKANVGVADANPAKPETPAKTTEPAVDWKAKFEEAEANRVALQRNLADREAKLRQAQRRGSDTDTIRGELADLKQTLARQVDYTNYVVENLTKGEANYGEPHQPGRPIPTPTYDAFQKAEAERQKKTAEEQRLQQEVREFFEDLGEAGLSFDDPEVKEYFSKIPNPNQAQRKLPVFVAQRLQKQVADKAKVAETEAKEKARKTAESGGGLDIPKVAASSSRTSSDKEFIQARDAFIKNPNNPKVQEAYMKLKFGKGG